MDTERLVSNRAKSMDASGIRRVFDLGAKLKDPINFSIGQPDFPVPEAVKNAACKAIHDNHNGYTLSQGIPPLKRRIAQHLSEDIGWPADAGEAGSSVGIIVTTGTSGAIHIAMLALLDEGDEIIIPDPYFVAYPSMARVAGGRAIRCNTYPDFRMTAERIEPLITPRTKAVMLNSPCNPSGVVISERECLDVLDLCRRRGVLLISDEIYDEFTFDDAREVTGHRGSRAPRCPSPCRADRSHEDILLIRGFGKTYGCTGWRMGYTAGPRKLIEQMTKMQQYSFVCAPAPMQWGCLATFDTDMTETVARFRHRRDTVLAALRPHAEIVTPGGAFYAFIEVPRRLGMTGQQFFERAVEKNVLVIPGNVFSDRDTHFRLSFAVSEDRLEQGLGVLAGLLKG